MERAINSENLEIEFDVVPDIEEEFPLAEPRKRARKIYRAPVEKHPYAKILGGLVTMLALVTVPLVTLPGMIIPVLIAEVYILDWTYSKFSLLRGFTSSTSRESAEKKPEDEIDRKVARTGQKHQFMK